MRVPLFCALPVGVQSSYVRTFFTIRESVLNYSCEGPYFHLPHGVMGVMGDNLTIYRLLRHSDVTRSIENCFGSLSLVVSHTYGLFSSVHSRLLPAPSLRKPPSSEGRVVDSSKTNPAKGDDEVEEREELGGDEDDSVTAKEVPPDEQQGSFLRPAFADCGGAGAGAATVGVVEAGDREGRVSRRSFGGTIGVPLPPAVGNSLHGAKSSDDLSSVDSSLSG